jgi:hypothetical protein
MRLEDSKAEISDEHKAKDVNALPRMKIPVKCRWTVSIPTKWEEEKKKKENIRRFRRNSGSICDMTMAGNTTTQKLSRGIGS